MSEQLKSVLEQARQLTLQERGDLATLLLAELDHENIADDGAEWGEELRRRMEDVRTGRESLVPWEDVRTKLQGIIDGAR